MAGNPKTVDEAIEKLVARLLEGIDCPPTDLTRVAPRLNVTSIHAEDIPGSGGLRRVGKSFHVVYAEGLPLGRQNFTVAHELGHALLASTGPGAPRAGKDVELLCNAIAAELLLPVDPFRRFIGKDPNPQKIIEAANTFCVSIESSARRCAEVSGATAFLVEEEEMIWCYGVRHFKEVRNEFAQPVQDAIVGQRVTVSVSLPERGGGARLWSVSGQPLSGSRALFVAKPVSSLVIR